VHTFTCARTHTSHTRACSTVVNVECFARALSRASVEPARGALARPPPGSTSACTQGTRTHGTRTHARTRTNILGRSSKKKRRTEGGAGGDGAGGGAGGGGAGGTSVATGAKKAGGGSLYDMMQSILGD
jgi:hypothetical protein